MLLGQKMYLPAAHIETGAIIKTQVNIHLEHITFCIKNEAIRCILQKDDHNRITVRSTEKHYNNGHAG